MTVIKSKNKYLKSVLAIAAFIVALFCVCLGGALIRFRAMADEPRK